MRRQHFFMFALLSTALAAGSVHAQGSNGPQTTSTDDRFHRFDDTARAVVPEPATLGMIVLGGSALFYPRRRARLYR